MKKISLKSVMREEILSRDDLKRIMGGVSGSGSGGSTCTDSCEGGEQKYICYDVMCVGARREVCSIGRPSGYTNCSPA